MTAVEYLIEELEADYSKIARIIGLKKYNSIIQQAKEMEKQQIIDAVVWFDDTERTPSQIDIGAQLYYNETFKSE